MRVIKNSIKGVVAGAVVLGVGALSSQAATFNGSLGSLSASASFNVSGTTLTVALANTSGADVLVPTDVLTAVLFSTPTALTPVSATLSAGSAVEFAPAGGSGPNVGGEWAYNASGISSSGFGLFGPGNRFDTSSNLQGPADPDGLQYGLASAGDNSATGNAFVTGANALIKNSVTFTLTVPAGFTDGDITGVIFQYGTALTDTRFPPDGGPVPDGGSTIALLGFALVGADILRRKVVKA